MALRDKWPDGTNKTDEQIAAEKAGKVVENPNAPKAPVIRRTNPAKSWQN